MKLSDDKRPELHLVERNGSFIMWNSTFTESMPFASAREAFECAEAVGAVVVLVTDKKTIEKPVTLTHELIEACTMALIEYRGLKDKIDSLEGNGTGNDDACTNILNYVINRAKVELPRI